MRLGVCVLVTTLLTSWPGHVTSRMYECPEGWQQHEFSRESQPGRDRICYKKSSVKADYATSKASCPSLHPGATLVMPKTQAQDTVVLDFYCTDIPEDALWIGLEETGSMTGEYRWLDGTTLGSWNDWYPGEPHLEADCTPDGCVVAMAKALEGWTNVGGTGDFFYLCQIMIPEWACLTDRLKEPSSPGDFGHLFHQHSTGTGPLREFNHHNLQTVGCRQVLTCSSRVIEDGATVKGLTVNLRQQSVNLIQAEIDLLLQDDALISIAFTEGTSPGIQDGGETCNAESLGLFLPRHNRYPGPFSNRMHWSIATHGYEGLHGIWAPRKTTSNHPAELVKMRSVTGGVKATFNLRELEGFESLAELAGRGVLVCPSVYVEDMDEGQRCVGGSVPLCCSLGWGPEASENFLD